MKPTASAQAKFAAFDAKFQAYVNKLRVDWLKQNRVNSRDVYEVMRPEERAEVHRCIDQWARYITPLAEAWWRERGYGVIWSDDNSEPVEYYELEVV